jgi:hypothetical protein
MTGPSATTPVAAGARLFMLAAAVFVAAAGVSLFFLSEQTNQFFAWTIKPPVTAAFIGGGYLAVTTALALALRKTDWAQVRVGVWVVATGLVSILVATLLHLDKFHLHSPIWSAQAWAWSWLFLYVALVPALIAALWTQRRKTATESPRRAMLPPALRLALRLLGGLMLVIGAALFVAPGAAEQLWPWPLTPLTARMVGSFYVAFAVSLFAAARENDYVRIQVASFAYVVFAAAQAVNAVRYPAVNWQELPGLMLAVVLIALFAIGVTGVRGYLASRPGNN